MKSAFKVSFTMIAFGMIVFGTMAFGAWTTVVAESVSVLDAQSDKYPNTYQISIYSSYQGNPALGSSMVETHGAIVWTERDYWGATRLETTLTLSPGNDATIFKVAWTDTTNKAALQTNCYLKLAVTEATLAFSLGKAKYQTKAGATLGIHNAMTLLTEFAKKAYMEMPEGWDLNPGWVINQLIDLNTDDPRAVSYSRC